MSQMAKTEPATARRLLNARQQGDHPLSPIATAVGAWIAAGCSAALIASQAVDDLQHMLLQALSEPPFPFAVRQLLEPLKTLTLPVLGAATLGAITVGLGQTRGHLSLKPLLGPFSSLSRGANTLRDRWLSALAGVLVFALLLAWALSALSSSGHDLATATNSVDGTVYWLKIHGRSVLGIMVAMGLGTASIDLIVRRGLWLRRHRMSSLEVEQEQSKSEADPELKQLRREAHRQAMRETEVERLCRAKLLVTGPDWVTTALGYDPKSDSAPRILLQGAGAMGCLLQSEARALRKPVFYHPGISKTLCALGPDQSIPESCFIPIATAMGTGKTGIGETELGPLAPNN